MTLWSCMSGKQHFVFLCLQTSEQERDRGHGEYNSDWVVLGDVHSGWTGCNKADKENGNIMLVATRVHNDRNIVLGVMFVCFMPFSHGIFYQMLPVLNTYVIYDQIT